jgi:hypothetical protein
MPLEQILNTLKDDSVEMICILTLKGSATGSEIASLPKELTKEQETLAVQIAESLGNLESVMTRIKSSFKAVKEINLSSEDKIILGLRLNSSYVLFFVATTGFKVTGIKNKFDNKFREDILNAMVAEGYLKEDEKEK